MTIELPQQALTGQLENVSRSVTVTPDDGTVAIELEVSQVYATTPDDLWQAVTTADRLARWFAVVHGDLTLGGSYQVEGNAGGVVQSCEPPSRFTATWVMGEPASLIDVRVEPVDADHTRLRLIHSGEIEAGFWDLYGPGALGVGWDLGLLGLALHLGSGWTKPPEVETEWVTSEQAKQFSRDLSAAWVDASIAAGTDPSAARAAGEQTSAFYTGEAAGS